MAGSGHMTVNEQVLGDGFVKVDISQQPPTGLLKIDRSTASGMMLMQNAEEAGLMKITVAN
jgi:hypothetical protein